MRRQLSVRLLAPLIELTYSRATARRAERERFSNTAVGSYKMHRWLRTELPAVIRVEDRDGVVPFGSQWSFFEVSLCLSRACLGKMIVYIYKWLKKAVFCRLGYVARLSDREGKKPPLLRHFILKTIVLPRQARGKHSESTQKESGVFVQERGLSLSISMNPGFGGGYSIPTELAAQCLFQVRKPIYRLFHVILFSCK
eukprot:COSAG06_NODE_2096_length_7603_cov_8.520656_6_plen_198_part_00